MKRHSENITEGIPLVHLLIRASDMLDKAIKRDKAVTIQMVNKFEEAANKQLESHGLSRNDPNVIALRQAIGDARNIASFQPGFGISRELGQQSHQTLETLNKQIEKMGGRVKKEIDAFNDDSQSLIDVNLEDSEISEEDVKGVVDVEKIIREYQKKNMSLGERFKNTSFYKFFKAIGDGLKEARKNIKEIKKLHAISSLKNVQKGKVSPVESVSSQEDKKEYGLDDARIKSNQRFADDPIHGGSADYVGFQQIENDIFYFKEILKKGEESSIDMGERIAEMNDLLSVGKGNEKKYIDAGFPLKKIGEVQGNLSELDAKWKTLQAKAEVNEKFGNYTSPVDEFFQECRTGIPPKGEDSTLPDAVEKEAKDIDDLATQIDNGNPPENLDAIMAAFEKDERQIMTKIYGRGQLGVEAHWGEGNLEEGNNAIQEFRDALDQLKEVVQEYKSEAGKSLDM